MEYTPREGLYLLLDACGVKRLEPFLARFHSAEDCVAAAKRRTPEWREAAAEAGGEPELTERAYERALTELARKRIRVITRESAAFPEKLTPAGVYLLYCRGNAELLSKRSAAIVGTRRCSTYGAKCARYFAERFGEAGLAVVSGLAAGIDAAAHEGALDARGATVAVMGVGLDYVYPPENEGLLARIEESGGLAVSEYRPQDRGKPFQFLRRNRIIAALSDAVVVAEAPEKSGALKTAEDAYTYGRKVFAVPGGIFTRSAAGSNNLIRTGNAQAAFCSEDVLEALHMASGTPAEHTEYSEPPATPLVALLRRGVTHFDELAERAGLTPAEASEQLLLLEIEGVVHRKAGNEYELL